jgi:hypothetical protein
MRTLIKQYFGYKNCPKEYVDEFKKAFKELGIAKYKIQKMEKELELEKERADAILQFMTDLKNESNLVRDVYENE